VSLVPNFNRALCESVMQSLPGVPYATVLTDMADLPPHFWIEPGLRQHLICGTPRAAAQARAAGYGIDAVSLTSGMILRPDFYEPRAQLHRAERLRSLGLDPHRPTGVVMFGGQGSMKMLTIARALKDVQLILMCGHNEPLRQALMKARARAPHTVIGFTAEMSCHLALGDFFIGKPGPGSLSEAVHLGLPVITFRNAWTMPQERYNTDWVREQGVGLVLKSLRQLPLAAAEMIGRLPEFQAAVGRIDNRAVFEVPEILARLLKAAEQPLSNQALGWPDAAALPAVSPPHAGPALAS
jgi:UDP-N-acetylglucosamine:LPS N-acetylglucosamine transferase